MRDSSSEICIFMISGCFHVCVVPKLQIRLTIQPTVCLRLTESLNELLRCCIFHFGQMSDSKV